MPKPLTQNIWIKNWRRLALRTDANEIAEAAAVLPLLFMVLIGIFWFGQAFRIYGTITRAAQEGARAAVAPACSTCTSPISPPALSAYNAISNVLQTARLDPLNLNKSTTAPALHSCIDGSAVACDGTPSNICVQENVRLSDKVTGSGVCGVSVTFQYPYQFWLPFASLNQQRIQIPAAARVRQETQ